MRVKNGPSTTPGCNFEPAVIMINAEFPKRQKQKDQLQSLLLLAAFKIYMRTLTKKWKGPSGSLQLVLP